MRDDGDGVLGGAQPRDELEVGNRGERQGVERPPGSAGRLVVGVLVGDVHAVVEEAARRVEPEPEGVAGAVLRHLRAVQQPEARVGVRREGVSPALAGVARPGLAGAQEVDTLRPADPPDRREHRRVPGRVGVQVRVGVAVGPAHLAKSQPRLERHRGLRSHSRAHVEGELLRKEVDPPLHLERVGTRPQRHLEHSSLVGEDAGQVFVPALDDFAGGVADDDARGQGLTAAGVDHSDRQGLATRHRAQHGHLTRRRGPGSRRVEEGREQEKRRDRGGLCRASRLSSFRCASRPSGRPSAPRDPPARSRAPRCAVARLKSGGARRTGRS